MRARSRRLVGLTVGTAVITIGATMVLAAPETRSFAFVARGDNPIDALAAAPIAGRLNAPVLLTPPNELEPAAADGLVAADPDVVVIAGGTAAISANVADEIATLLPDADVRRVAGSTRYSTAQALAALIREYDASFVVPDDLTDVVRQEDLVGVLREGDVTGVPARVVTVEAGAVATTNGASLLSAASGLTGPAVLLLGPGTYDLGTDQLVLPPKVDLVGAGGSTATVVTGHRTAGSADGSGAVVRSRGLQTIRDVTIQSTGNPSASSTIATGLWIDGSAGGTLVERVHIDLRDHGGTMIGVHHTGGGDTVLRDVEIQLATVSGSFSSRAVQASSTDTPTLVIDGGMLRYDGSGSATGVQADAPVHVDGTTITGGTTGSRRGVAATSTDVMITDSVIDAVTPSGSGYAVEVSAPSAEVRVSGSRLTGSGDVIGAGIHALGPIQVDGSVLRGVSPGFAVGVWSRYDGVQVRSSRIEGASTAVFFGLAGAPGPAAADIGSSQIVGSVDTSGTATCVGAYDGDYVALGTNCQP